MRNYKDATDINEIIKLVKKKLNINLVLETKLKKGKDGFLNLKDGDLSVDVAPHKIWLVGADVKNNTKVHALLKKEKYAVFWLKRSHRTFFISIKPTDNYKQFGFYW